MTYATSTAGLALIQQFEGFRAEPAQLPDGNWLVGFSHVRVGEPGAPLGESEAANMLTMDLAPYEKLVNARVTQPLNQAQFDALVSFAFSVGAESFEQSQVLRRVNAGDYVAAACAMDAWRKSDVSGELEIVDALVRRRAAEKALFLRDMTNEAAPSVFLRAKLDYAASVLGAPTKYASPPAVGSIPVAQPKPEPVARLTEILKSEPATEVLLLTQVVTDEFVAEDGEIVTAHAKPVARPLDQVREATRVAYEAKEAKRREKKGFLGFKRNTSNEIAPVADIEIDRRLRTMRQKGEPRFQFDGFADARENIGLMALMAFGIALIALGGSLLFDGAGDLVAIAGAIALVTPGLAATLISAFGLWRGGMKPAAA